MLKAFQPTAAAENITSLSSVFTSVYPKTISAQRTRTLIENGFYRYQVINTRSRLCYYASRVTSLLLNLIKENL